jgi:hypothetical protein
LCTILLLLALKKGSPGISDEFESHRKLTRSAVEALVHYMQRGMNLSEHIIFVPERTMSVFFLENTRGKPLLVNISQKIKFIWRG